MAMITGMAVVAFASVIGQGMHTSFFSQAAGSNAAGAVTVVEAKEIMPVIKANGYGTFINTKVDLLNEFNIVAVALVDEAIFLREIGYKNKILVLNQPDIHEISLINKYNITIGLSDKSFLDEMIRYNKHFVVHLEIETGMNRTGISLDDLDYFIGLIKNSNIEIEGVYSHLSSTDFDENYTLKQINVFKNALEIINKNKINVKYIHLSASNGILKYEPLPFTNMVRPGLIMYGYEPFHGSTNIINTKPICKLKSTITFIKEVPKGTAISYSQKYITKENKVIATIPIGYGDGFRRCLSNNGCVLINGVKAPIVGTICMDSFMVDVSHIDNVSVGDEVILFDNENITLDDIALKCNTINYEILCNLNSRIPRLFIEE